jgi:hypothetical protein
MVISKAAAAAGDPGLTRIVEKKDVGMTHVVERKNSAVSRSPSVKEREAASAVKEKDTPSSTTVVRSSSVGLRDRESRKVDRVSVPASPIKDVRKIDNMTPPTAVVANKKVPPPLDVTFFTSPAVPAEPVEPPKRSAPAIRAENFMPVSVFVSFWPRILFKLAQNECD